MHATLGIRCFILLSTGCHLIFLSILLSSFFKNKVSISAHYHIPLQIISTTSNRKIHLAASKALKQSSTPAKSHTQSLTLQLGAASASSAMTSASSSSSFNEQTQIKNSYLGELKQRIEALKYYPRRALQLGLEGDVVLSLLITAEGELRDVTLVQRSPYELLNQAALEIIQNLDTFEPIPAELKLDYLQVEIPLRYQISQNRGMAD